VITITKSINIVDAETDELIASIGENDVIVTDGYDVIEIDD